MPTDAACGSQHVGCYLQTTFHVKMTAQGCFQDGLLLCGASGTIEEDVVDLV